MSPGQTRFVPGTKWVCPRDKPRFSSYFTQRKPSLSLGQTQFVPGTFRGRRAADRIYVLKVYVPFSFPRYDCTIGGPQDGNEWRKYRVVLCAHPSRPLFMLIEIGLEAKALSDFQGRRGITSVVRWNLRPVIGVEQRELRVLSATLI